MHYDGFSITLPDLDYDQKLAANLIRFLSSSVAGQGADPSQAAQRFLLKFEDTNILYSQAGYDGIEGDYLMDGHDELNYLVASGDFRHATTLNPLNFAPFEVPRPAIEPPATGTPGICVIVPVYGSLQHTWDIRNEIEAFLPELRSLGGRVVISVDGHPDPSQVEDHLSILDGLDAKLVKTHKHPENLGFIGNVNFLFSKTKAKEIVVLLTTDVKMEPKTLTRVCTPLLNDDKIALATPYAIGGENLEAPDSTVLFWRDLDRIMGGMAPSYPDAETNVGYLLAIDRRKYKGETLFDRVFENGYGDDSDLYYRCVNLGYRGVVVDNCCVFHEHGASFSHTGNRDSLRVQNFRRFMERWGEVYLSRRDAASDVINGKRTQQGKLATALSMQTPAPQIVFFLPTNDRRIGGVRAVFDLAEGICNSGIPAAVICANKPADESGAALKSIQTRTRQCEMVLDRAAWLVATSHDTCPRVKTLAKRHDCKTGYFIQGPEFSFSEGSCLSSVITGYSGFDAIFTVSHYLKDVVGNWVKEPVHVIPYGPPLHKYFETNNPREERSIAVQLSGNHNKGAAYVAGVIAALVPHGYNFYSFGNEELRGSRNNLCTHLGFLSTAEKNALFNRVEFYLDASNFEGLGLLLMESARCGAIPLYRHNGGTADLLKAAGAGIEVGDYAGIGKIHNQLEKFREQGLWEAERTRCKEAINAHKLENAVTAMVEWWNE